MSRLDNIRRVAGKEMSLFFAGGMGYLFLLAFLGITAFVFFWSSAFFARNIADVRPLFTAMPGLLIFLCSALTMRMWSEERRAGTLEFVQTLPVSSWDFVLGKFVACLGLLSLALLATISLPITVAAIANLDWGPVFAGYVAALLLGGAYIAVGLYVSSRSDSQIVSLILSSTLCGLFYLVGTGVLTDLVGQSTADLFRNLSTSARFESITRGVLDFRDLFYYLSLLVGFLALNVFVLEKGRWAAEGDSAHHRGWLLGLCLLVANLVVANVWLTDVRSARIDLTQGQLYSLSDASRSNLAQLEEPLLIRGYFSDKTHPLLAPLVPQLRDLLEEFAVAGGERVRVEIVDPVSDPALEDEANSKYGIRPVPFQVADRHQASLVNSYFDVLVSYGDQYEVLGFRDLIEAKVASETELDVRLRNPEYDLTRAIKKAIASYRSGGGVFDSISDPVRFVGYVSQPQQLPEQLNEFTTIVKEVMQEFSNKSAGKLSVEFVDPAAGDGSVATQIRNDYGFAPMAASFFDTNSFYYYLTLHGQGDVVVQLPIPETRDAESFRRILEDGLKRFATGLLKTVAMVTPPAPAPYLAQQGVTSPQYNQLREFLRVDYQVEQTDLVDGVVPSTASILLLLEPQALSRTQLFAVDQFLMRGGSVILVSSPFSVQASQRTLSASPRASGLEEWLSHQGVEIEQQLVLDPQNAAFPVPVTRQAGGFSFQELQLLDYPYFIDLRESGLNQDNAITADLPQLTLPWASPVIVDSEKNEQRKVTELLRSSADSWLSNASNVMPRLAAAGQPAFEPAGEQATRTLATLLEGRFQSFFAGQDSPLLAAADVGDVTDPDATDNPPPSEIVSSVIDRSPESARLFVFGSNALVADQTLRMIGAADGAAYSNSVQLLGNVVDWALEDRSLLSIRSRGHFNRTLPPLETDVQTRLEYLNYAALVVAIFLIWLCHRLLLGRSRRRYASWLDGGYDA